MILDKRNENRKIVIVGDIHGCYYTLTEGLLPALGFDSDGNHPENLKLVSVGDLHDRGGIYGLQSPDVTDSGAVKTLRWALEWTKKGSLDVVDSNHGKKVSRKLITGERADSDGKLFGHGVSDTLKDIDLQPDAETLIPELIEFLQSRPSFARYSGGPTGEIIVAHAAVNHNFLNLEDLTRKEKDYCIFPREFIWKGSATVVVGHVVTEGVKRERYTRSDGSLAGEIIRIDTGAYDGGGLTAYFPETDTSITVPTDARDYPDETRRERNKFTG